MSDKEALVMTDTPDWADTEEAIEYFKQALTSARDMLARIMWEAGRTGVVLKDDAKYGDGAIEKFAEGIGKGKSWIYECIAMYQTYTWEDVQKKFLVKDIPASTIARIGSIKDEGERNYVEDKLVNGEISYEEIADAKREYNNVINNPEVSHSEIGEGTEQTIAELAATRVLDDDDPNNVATAIIRSHFGKLKRLAEEQMVLMEDTLTAYDKLGDISDESLYELAQDRIITAGVKLQKQAQYIENIIDTVKKLKPEEFEES
jgi:hypothetical protein